MLIAVNGYAQVGKDTTGLVLGRNEKRPFRRMAFADKIRECLYALNPDVTILLDTSRADHWPDSKAPKVLFSGDIVPLQALVDGRGWEWAKAHSTARALLQRLGTEAGRNVLGQDVWVNAVMTDVDNLAVGYAYNQLLLQRLGTEAGRNVLGQDAYNQLGESLVDICFTDCRFPNEAQAVKDRGGVIWRVERTGVGPATNAAGEVHESETALDGWLFDAIIWNNGDLDTMTAKVNAQLGFLL